MAKHGKRRRTSRRQSFNSMQKGKSKTQAGGAGAAENVMAAVGDGQTQFNNVMMGSQTSNVIQPISQHVALPVPQSGGRRSVHRRRNGKGRTKKGGYWGAVLEQAIVPLTLLGLQQKFPGRRHNNRTQRRR